MKIATKNKLHKTATVSVQDLSILKPENTIEWFGEINFENLERVIDKIKNFKEAQLMVNSYGGPTGVAMSFYDTVRNIFKTKLTTIGSGYVDSSAIVVFLAGEKRLITKNTTLLLHLAGRKFEAEKRYSTKDMEDMLKEDKLKDYQYACVVSDATGGRYSPEMILEMMANNTVLTAEEAVNMGLAHKVV